MTEQVAWQCTNHVFGDLEALRRLRCEGSTMAEHVWSGPDAGPLMCQSTMEATL
jgi:hypothetical protein